MVPHPFPTPSAAPLSARTLRAVAIFLLAGFVGCGSQRPATEDESTPGADGSAVDDPAADSVRAAREAFNRAIAEMAMAPIEALVMEDNLLVTGRSSIHVGGEPHLQLWREDFAAPGASYIYVRTPREVRVNSGFGLAEELGDWVGRPRSGDGSGEASGVYAAKWQRATNGSWMLQSEVFTTLACRGPICEPPDPVEGR